MANTKRSKEEKKSDKETKALLKEAGVKVNRKETKKSKKLDSNATDKKLEAAKIKQEKAKESGKKRKFKRATKAVEKAEKKSEVVKQAQVSSKQKREIENKVTIPMKKAYDAYKKRVNQGSKNDSMASTLRTESPLTKYGCGYNSKKKK